ncbi:MAG: methylmalonyl-CoA epimerase [Deltaproteobacteria bacterium CG11_big_fil_rev_8_21_14_0_20_47_16]|nr:MAG: methylmalonyl-CoA epimerase [Deltaproteobacteria bacterium CG11_big_fil_rev_8_21_14_0_20_47_16]
MTQLDHIGIAVADMDAAIATYTQLLGAAPTSVEDVPTERVRTAFFKVGETQVELLAATSDDSPIAKFIAKNGEGVHHMAFRVTDIRTAIVQYQKDGFTVIGDAPRPGAHDTQVVFLHPKTTHGTLIELVQLSQ